MRTVPEFVVGKIIATDYLDGKSSEVGAKGDCFIRRIAERGNDLQSAGISADQFTAGAPPAFANPASPTPAELRRLAIFNDYSQLIDTSKAGGFGLLAGPQPNRKVFGREYLAFARHAGTLFTVMAQIPESFDARRPMIVTAPSSGSRGIYGAISTAEFAFAKNCAVAFTDKGTGPGFHVLDSDSVYGLDGTRLAATSGAEAVFKVPGSRDLDAYKRSFPHRLAVKHAHSEINVEAHWGRHVLISVAFCLFCLNDWLGERHGPFTRPRTKVIAAGVSNGGGAALRAAEQDDAVAPLIDAVVVSEPQIQPSPRGFAIRHGNALFTGHSRSFLDTVTLMDVYAPCAALAMDTSDPTSPVQQRRIQRCAALAERGLLRSGDLAAQANEALAIINGHGLLPEANALLPALDILGMWPLLAAVYSSAHAKAGISDHLCGVSIAHMGAAGAAKAMPAQIEAQLFGLSNGLAYSAAGGTERSGLIDDQAVAPWSLGAALCFRSLVTGVSYQGQNAVEARWVDSGRMAAGISEVKATGDLHGKPAIVLHGRSDALLPPNHMSRAYFGLNKLVERERSRLSYIEIVNGNHFDSFIPLFGGALPIFGPNTLVPMHYYFGQALDLMVNHLLGGAGPLPPSQIVMAKATRKPWDNLEKVEADMPAIAMAPAPRQQIAFSNGVVEIPS